MVLLVTTKPILAAFDAISSSSRENLELPDSLALGEPISHDQVIRISRFFRDNHTNDANDEDRSLDALLRGMRIYIPPPPPKPEPSPEYLALKARLLAAAEADAYHRMTSPTPTGPSASAIFSSSSPTVAALHDAKSTSTDATNSADPLTPSLVLNIFLSVLITGFSVYWALTKFHTPDILITGISSLWHRSSGATAHRTAAYQGRGSGAGAGASEPVRVLLSLFAALGVGVAEVLIYAIYLGKIEQARSRERRVRERKEIVGREEIGRKGDSEKTPRLAGEEQKEEEEEEEEEGQDTETAEVIWGRGPNGGLRRRVREKWEEGEEEIKKKESKRVVNLD
ncbi:hypothetical protein ARAM_001619, partial [Aspergillus rambellii]